MKKALVSIILSFTAFLNFSQSCGSLMVPVSLELRSSEATLIVEGEVINSVSYWDNSHENIYTIHEVSVYQNAKGIINNTVFVETLGGQVGNKMQVTSSAANLKIGYTGVFFLKGSNHSFSIPQTTYQMVAAAQGFIKYDKVDNTASDIFNTYTSVENDVYVRLEQTTNRSLQFVQGRVSTNVTKSIFATPTISSLSPSTISAGTESILTISGTNFGATEGEVSFKYASDGGASYIAAESSQIISWNDTQIEVEVPSSAGSGTIRVTNATTETGTSGSSLTIPFSHSSATGSGIVYPRTLYDNNGNGGFTFDYHNDFDSSAAKQYFEEAFGVWNCQTGINFSFGTTTATDATADDGINIVRFDNGSELPSGVLGRVTTRLLGTCPVTGWAIVDEMDITWNDSTNWYYGSGTPGGSQYDFKTVALHELGHANQLGHVINSPGIMHYNLGAGVEKYALDSDDVDGANYTMGIFTSAQGCAGINSMTANSQCTYVPDDNFEAYLEANSMGNGIDGDDLVTTANITTITALSIANVGVSDLTGIEDFIALQDLNCNNNSLISLDLSSNINLQNILADDNSLTTANFTGITNLSTLTLNNNGLTTVDVSNRVMLKQLELEDNNLASVNVTGCSTLEKITTSSNSTLSSIDLSTNLALTHLIAVSNSFISLDLSQHSNLLEVDVADNDLTSFNIKNGNNTVIQNFRAIANYNLGCISVDSEVYSTTNWTGIDSNTSFSENCNATTNVPDDNFENYLETHDADGNTVTVGDTSSLGNGIANDNLVFTWKIDTLTSLNISNLSISDMTGIEDFIALTFLNAGNNSFTGIDVSNQVELVSLWIQIGGMTTLDVTSNLLLEDLRVQINSIPSIDLSNNTELRILQINNNNLTILDVANNTKLTRIRSYSNQLTSLDLSNQTVLTEIEVNDSDLSFLDVKNGNNSNVTIFNATNNSNLTCITVDDAAYAITNWANIDAGTTFNEHCFETYVPDDSFEAFLEANGMGNGLANDDYVTTANISAVTTVNLRSHSPTVTDLTGIQDFIAVKNLDVLGHNLSSLDVSQNIDLRNVWLNFNSNLASLDFSANPELRGVDLQGANGLTELIFPSTTLVTFLDVRSSKLTHIDLSIHPNMNTLNVSGATLLETLEAKGTSAATINTTGCSSLTCISVDSVADAIAGNGIYTNWLEDDTAVYQSLSCLTNVPDDNFENYLETHDASGNVVAVGDATSMGNGIANDDYVYTSRISGVVEINAQSLSISDLTGVENFIALEILSCYNNTISSIDVSSNTLLTNLLIGNNGLTSLDVSNNTQLTEVHCHANNISQLNTTGLVNLTELVAYSNELTSVDLSDSILLEKLSIQKNDLNLLDVTVHTELKSLLCYENNLISLDVSNNVILETLTLRNNAIPSIDLSNNLELYDLDFSSTSITSIDISMNTKLWYLSFANNSLANIDVSNNLDIYEIYGYNTLITNLDLSNHPNIEVLYCQNNQLTSLNLKNGNNGDIADFDITGNANLTCVLVDDAAYATTNWTNKDAQTNYNELSCGISVSPRVFLQGAFTNPNVGEETLMRDDLRVGGLIPTSSTYADGLTCNASVFTPTGTDAIVDWVWVELRDAGDNSVVIASQSALLQRDGDVVGVDGVSPLVFDETTGNYFVVVSHRSHLGIMSAATVALSGSNTVVDLSANSASVLGTTNAVVNMTGVFALVAGDFDENSQIQNTDINSVILLLGGAGYNKADVDMNGQIQNSDINTILYPNLGKGQQF